MQCTDNEELCIIRAVSLLRGLRSTVAAQERAELTIHGCFGDGNDERNKPNIVGAEVDDFSLQLTATRV